MWLHRGRGLAGGGWSGFRLGAVGSRSGGPPEQRTVDPRGDRHWGSASVAPLPCASTDADLPLLVSEKLGGEQRR